MTQPHVLSMTARTVSVLLTSDAAFALPSGVPWTLEVAGSAKAHEGVAQSAVLFVEGLEPETDYRLRSGLGEVRFTTKPCAGLIHVSEFGARPDLADNSTAFADAINAVPEGGTLCVDNGRYQTGPIFLKPDMTLWITKGSEIAAIGDRKGWPILPAHDDSGRALGTWEGLPEACFAAVITGVDCDRLAITGKGVIDGGGDRADWWLWPKETRDGARRPRTVHLAYCKDVSITGVTVRNSPSWTVHPYRCERLHALALSIENPADSPNTDGLNPESCRGVDICGVAFSVGDDCIAIKAGKRGPGQIAHLAPCEDITIRHCHMGFGHGAVVIGSEMSGEIRDVRIADCTFTQTDRGLRLKTRRGRGGVIENVTMTRVAMAGVATPFCANAFYFCDPDGKEDWVQSRKAAPVDETTPLIIGIRLTSISATGVTLAAAAILGLPEAPITDVEIDAFDVSYDPEARADVPLMALGVPPVRHGGIIAEFARVDANLTVRTNDRESAPC